MTRHTIPALALAAVVAVFTTHGLGEDAGAAGHKLRATAAGDWSCSIGDEALGTLSVRGSSYMLNRSGASMAGEYRQAEERVIVTSGPLRGLGVDSGTLLPGIAARTLEFPTASGDVLACREVL